MRYRRIYTEGGSYFFTVVTYKRQKIFKNADNVCLLKLVIKEIINRFPFTIEAIVILPEHLHCIWTLPDGDSDFSLRWRLIKTRFTKKYFEYHKNFFDNNKNLIWQNRFWEHQIRNERDYNLRMDYIHYNPVKHQLVKSPKNWAYSSFHACVQKKLYPVDWGANIDDNYFDKIVNAE